MYSHGESGSREPCKRKSSGTRIGRGGAIDRGAEALQSGATNSRAPFSEDVCPVITGDVGVTPDPVKLERGEEGARTMVGKAGGAS